MSQALHRRDAVRSIIAAALAFGLAGCGGGGGGGPLDSSSAAGATPTPVPPLTSTPEPVAQSRFFASWTTGLLDATATLPGGTASAAQTFNNQSIRQVLRLSLGGDAVRLKLSNRFGTAPVTFSGVHLAKSATLRSDIDPASDRAVTFGGQPAVTLPAGAELLSDPVTLPVAPQTTVAVTLYFAGTAVMPTVHVVGRQTAYIAPGNQLSATSIAAAPADLRESYYGLAAVETSSIEAGKVVVAFGDSLTDGIGSSLDAAKRYPNQLDDRLKAAGLARIGVVNTGIAGNRWLNDFAGPNGSGRFERDVLDVAGVTHTIIQMGINDIGFSVSDAPTQDVSAQQIIGAIAAAVAKAGARGVKVFLGTLAPYQGSASFTDSGELKRQTVNAAIRNAQGIDGVIDFDRVLQDPANPSRLNPLYDNGDHLHPNDAGYAAMAAAVDLSKLSAP